MITAHSYFTIAFSICVLTPRHNDCTTMTCCFLSYIVAFCSCPNVMNQLSKPLIKNGRSLLLLTALLHKSYINANKQGFSGICHEAHVIVGQSWKWCMLMLYSGKVKWVYNPTTNSNLAHGCVLCVCHGTEFYFIQVFFKFKYGTSFLRSCDRASWQILIIKPTYLLHGAESFLRS